MSALKVLFVTLLAGTLSISVALFGQHWIDGHPHLALSLQQPPQRAAVLPDLRLSTLDGRQINSHRWAGKVVVMHFWASWCTPCLMQIGALERLQARYGPEVLQVVSIAIDTPEDIQDFTSTRTINYQILLGDLKEMKLAQRFGNRTQSLPFTIVFDYQGHAVFHYAGALSEERLNAEVSALLPDTTTPPAQVSAPAPRPTLAPAPAPQADPS